MNLTTHFHLGLSLRMSRAIPSLTHIPTWHAWGWFCFAFVCVCVYVCACIHGCMYVLLHCVIFPINVQAQVLRKSLTEINVIMSLICLYYFPSSIFLKPHWCTWTPLLWHNYIPYFSQLTSRFRIVLVVAWILIVQLLVTNYISFFSLKCLYLCHNPLKLFISNKWQ
jgi:hypothetical protein